ncbi:MAG TPA: tetratricopeptide repeat protein [Gemmataceae bacterium]|nr:tetratricopeptide repeat protein [Gemmataceae bacterium]
MKIEEALQTAFRHHQAGNLQQAEQLYCQILQVQPQQVDALHLLGLICQRTGRHERAVEYIRQALRLKPDYADAHSNLGIVLRQMGRLDEAIACYRQALRLRPNNPEAYNNLGVALREQKQLDEAAACYRQALQLKPNYAEAYNNLGIVLADQGKLDEAIASYRRALQLKPNYAEAYNNLGNTLRRQGKLEEALASFREALRLRPRHADTHYNLAVALAEQGKLDEAVAGYRQALALQPDHPEALNNLGVALTELHRLDEAVAVLREAVRRRPHHAEAYTNLGNALKEQGQIAEALDCFREALRLKPDFAPAYINMGAALMEDGKPEEAMLCYQRALGSQPDSAEAMSNLGTALLELGHVDEAVARCREALRLRPDNPEALTNLGAALRAQGKLDEAMACYQQALRLRPDYPEALNNLGIALIDQGKIDEAIACYQQALRLKPDSPEALNQLGLALAEQGDIQGAMEHFQQALRLQPDHAGVLTNLGNLLLRQGKATDAVANYQQALRSAPDQAAPPSGSPRAARPNASFQAAAHMNRAMAWLLTGDFERGWPEYEWRWQTKDFKPRRFPQPRWDGAPLHGRTILLHAEQGLGDTIQFIRYARLVKERGGRVVVESPLALVPLLARCPGIDQLVASKSPLPPFDVHAPLLSLPAILRTTLDTIPADIPYLFADPDLQERWRQRLDSVSGCKVGIVWQGNPKHKGDRWRSVPLERFAPLAAVPGVRLISLQKGYGAEQLAALGGRFEVIDPEQWVDGGSWTFADTAAVVANLDLVVSVDTAVAHLAGAMGMPVWVALPFAPDWRWLLNREDSPWYPTMRLFRQTRPGDWDGVFRRLTEALAEYAAAPRPLPSRGRGPMASVKAPEPLPTALIAPTTVPSAGPAGVYLDEGVALAQQGKPDEAVARFQEALRLRPDYAEAHYNIGIVRAEQGRTDEAIASYREALRLNPDYAPAHINLGAVLARQGKLDEAIACHRQALRLLPDSAEARINLAAALCDRDQLEEACNLLQEAVRLAPERPEAHCNLGTVLSRQGKFDEAAACFEQALKLRPGYADALLNLGGVLLDQGKPAEAAAAFQRLLCFKPDHPHAHKNLSMVWLRMGDFERGWPEYEWRWRCGELTPRSFPQPRWDGAPLHGRTILLHAEQGLGDAIQFIRYAALVKERGGRVVVECSRPLVSLLRRCPGVDEVVARGATLPVFDVHAPLLSLPGIFRTTLNTIPARVPYLFADPEQEQRRRRELEAIPGLKVGIAWQGNPKHREDRRRSVPLERFESLAQVPGVRLVSLQKGPGADQLRELRGRFEVIDLGPQMQEESWTLTDTAAVVANLDLVVSVDTAVAHLAGAMGMPVWVALPFASDWRWLLNREDSPWYPTMRLFRQTRPGDWDGVFQRLTEALRERLGTAYQLAPILVETTAGELIDRITLLEIKSERLTDPVQQHRVRRELETLTKLRDRALVPSAELTELTAQLKEVNAALRRIEDDLRACEQRQDFGPTFGELARSLYRQNDRRAALKQRIDDLFRSRTTDEFHCPSQ